VYGKSVWTTLVYYCDGLRGLTKIVMNLNPYVDFKGRAYLPLNKF